MVSGSKQSKLNPRTARIQDIVLCGAVKLLVSEGREAVTALRVSEATGVARSTIYRHWPNQKSLLLGVIDRLVTPCTPTQVTDNLEADLTLAVTNLRTRLTKRAFRNVFSTLLDTANRDPEFEEAQVRFVKGVMGPIEDVLAAGIARGELPATLNGNDASARIAGPILAQHVMLRGAITDEFVAEILRQFLEQHRRHPHP